MTLPLLNVQPIEKKTSRDDGALEVFKMWKTIQGEGPLAGRPAVFIRLAGCNMQCDLCDTDYTSSRRLMTMMEVVGEVQELNKGTFYTPIVVFTGGEPFRQNFIPAAKLLTSLGFTVQIETNGTLWQETWSNMILIVCSPKSPVIHPEISRHVHALKYVIRANEVDPGDGLPLKALGGARPWRPDRPQRFLERLGQIFVQPLDEGDPARNQANLLQAADVSLKYGYQLGIQLHKYVGVE